MVPHLTTALTSPINELEARILESMPAIERWFRLEWMEHTPPFYSSVDLRNAGFKLAPVDTNLFPSTFDHLAPEMLPLAVQAAMAAIEKICPEAKNLLLVPGDPTRRPVRDALAEERAGRLLPLPARRFECDHVRPIASGKQPYVRFDRNDYSIPHDRIRQTLTLIASETEVRVVDGALASACADGRSVTGAPRLAQLSAPDRVVRGDACGDDWVDALSAISFVGPAYADVVCLDSAADQAPTVPGAQVVCTAEQSISPVEGGADRRAPLPWCGATAERPCWRISGTGTSRCPDGIEVRAEGMHGVDWVAVTLRCEGPCA